MNKAIKNTLTVVLLLVVVGGLAGAAFYQDEVGGFVRLQGWNTQPVAEATKRFVEAASKNDARTVASLVAQSPTLQPVTGNGGVVAFMIGDYGGPKRRTLREMCPNAAAKLTSPKLVYVEGGSVAVEAAYPGSHTLQIRWDRKPEGWRIVDLGWAG